MNDPSSPPGSPDKTTTGDGSFLESVQGWLRSRLGWRNGDDQVRETLEELIEDSDETAAAIGPDEKRLLANVLKLRDSTVDDVMVPRADIVGVDIDATLGDVTAVFTRAGHSRLVVYRGSLDDALGMVHIKDMLAWRGRDEAFRLSDIVRRALFVAPSMGVLELLLEMRVSRVHLALVVDEFGGIDGLATIEDLVEEIVGEFEGEHARGSEPKIDALPDGSLIVDGRVEIEGLEERLGPVLTEEERADIDTVGGLVVAIAGRVPIRGELIRHSAGLEFQILEADPRTVTRLKIRPIRREGSPARALAPSPARPAAGSPAAPPAAPRQADDPPPPKNASGAA